MFATDDANAIKRLLREHRMQIDPMFPGECRQILGNKGMRLNYYRESGLTIDGIGELLWERGVTTERLGTVEVLDLLAAVLIPDSSKVTAGYVDPEGKRKSRSVRASQKKTARKRCTHSDANSIETEAEKAKQKRLRKFICDECGDIARASLLNRNGRENRPACGWCDGRPLMRRVDPTFDEVMSQLAEVAA